MHNNHSPSIRSRYDYFYSMSPSSTNTTATAATNFYDNQHASLFGDPVQPPTGFLENFDSHLYGSLRRGSNVTSNYLSPSVANSRKGSDGFYPFVADGYGMQTTGVSTGLFDENRRSSGAYSDTIPRTRSAVANEFRNTLDNYQLQVESSPRRGSSSDAYGRTADWRTSIEDYWSNTIPRPRSSLNPPSLSGTLSDRSPLPMRTSSSSLNRLSSSARRFRETTPLPDTSKSASPASFRNEPPPDEIQRKASAVKRSREPSPVIVTDFITTGPYRLPDTRTTNKKTSFSILNEKKSESIEDHRPASRSASPQKQIHHPVRDPSARPKSNRVPLSSRSKRPSFEEFHYNDDPSMETYEITTDNRYKTMIHIADSGPMASLPRAELRNRSHETLSNIVRNETGLSASMRDLQRSGSMRKKKPNVPPLRPSKAVVQIVTDDRTLDSPSRIPRRQSLTGSGSKENLQRRGSTSFSRSGSRRSSRRSSVTQAVMEFEKKKSKPDKSDKSSSRQSLLKPSSLSPIIGTPNKDSELSSNTMSEKEVITVPDSPSKIPIRSRSNSRTGSHAVSRSNSRATSRPISREASPTKHSSKEPIKPNFLAPTRATSFRTRTPITMTSSLHRVGAAKSSTPVFGSLRNAGKKPPVKKSPVAKKKPHRKSPSMNSENSFEYKRGKSPLKRTPSPVKKIKSSSDSKDTLSPDKGVKKSLTNSKSTSSKSSESATKESKDNKPSKSEEKEAQVKVDDELKPEMDNKDKVSEHSDERSIKSMASATSIKSVALAGLKFKKLIPMTKSNVVSMTTAAVVSQPAQIQTTLTNQLSQTKLMDAGKEMRSGSPDPAAIIEKSTKTLENIQRQVSEVTDEINKTIEENLSELKTMENAIAAESARPTTKDDKKDAKPMLQKDGKTPSTRELLKKKMESGTPKMSTPAKTANLNSATAPQTSKPGDMKPSVPVEPTVNIIEKASSDKVASLGVGGGGNNGGSSVSANKSSNSEMSGATTASSSKEISAKPEAVELESGGKSNNTGTQMSSITTVDQQKHQLEQSKGVGSGSGGIGQSQGVGQSVKTQGSSPAVVPIVKQPTSDQNNNNNAETSRNGNQNKGGGSSSLVGESKGPPAATVTTVNEKRQSCCDPCCTKICCCIKWPNWCLRKPERTRPAMEMMEEKEKSCWKRMNCCASKKPAPASQIQTISGPNAPFEPESPGCCRSCLGRFCCCKSKHKVSSKRGSNALSYEVENTKCCFCIPCQRKRRRSDAWADSRRTSNMSNASSTNCCSRLCQTLCCCFCRKKKRMETADSRRTSMNSKKPSVTQEEKPKLDAALVEHNSMMKAAIPAMHICLAYFCLMCNVLIPGLGTILSGWFCLCFGKPRFSPKDGPRPRIGSLLINMIVGVAQAFTVIFCLVGWGWSIWWGMIMLKTARKYRKIKKAEMLTAAANAGKPILITKKGKKKAKAAAKAAELAAKNKDKDVEAAVK